MDTHSLKILEFDKIKKNLENFAKTDIGKEAIRKLSPEKDILIIKKKLKELSELKEAINVYGQIPLFELEEKNTLSKLDKCLYLSTEEIIYIYRILLTSKSLIDYFSHINVDYPNLSSWKNIELLDNLEFRIKRTIDENGEILDTASVNLKNIRKSILEIHTEIKQKLTNIFYSKAYNKALQDTIITIRNKRFVIPIKQEFRKNFQGIIQDESDSGATLFFEPIEIIEKNNESNDLYYREKQEINNILIELTKEINTKKNQLINNLNIIQKFDVLNAKATLSNLLNSREPEVNTSGCINIVGGKHPLLILNESYEKIIPVDISLGANFDALILSGANAGGKTAALKMLGLTVLMVQSGLHIPCKEGTTIGIFSQVWADIGDEQSLEKNLSTFSSHVIRIKHIIDQLNDNALILLDEICADTDPEEGANLAFSIIKYFTDKKARIITTTHFQFLKVLVLNEKNMLNASVEFDDSTLKPTYNIILGNIGTSKTLIQAENLGMPVEIINAAKEIQTQKDSIINSLTNTLREKHLALENEKNALEFERKNLNLLSIEEEEKIDLLKKEIKAYQTLYKKEFRTLTSNLKNRLDQVINKARERSNSETLKDFKQIISEHEKQLKKETPLGLSLKDETLSCENFLLGDKVKILDSNQTGEVIEKDVKQNTIKIKCGNVKLIVSPENAQKISSEKNIKIIEKNTSVSISLDEDVNTNITNKINIIGLTAEEAHAKIISFLEQAYLRHISPIEIIHGHGHGVLKKTVTEILTATPFVKDFRFGETHEGGSGITIINLAQWQG